MEKNIQKITLDESIDICPSCGYTDGFHTSFKVQKGTINIILICPQCHDRFDPGWEMEKLPGISEFEGTL